jgi:hypothetical protein
VPKTKTIVVRVGIFVAAIVLLKFLSEAGRTVLALALAFIVAMQSIDRGVAMRSGYNKILQAREIDVLLGKADHSVMNEGDANDEGIKEEWISEVYFGGRYELTMCVGIRVNRRTSEVSKVIGTPEFQLLELESVDMTSAAPSITYHAPGYHKINAAEWQRVVAAKGDFSVIGIDINRDRPIPNFKELVNWSKGRASERYPH